MVIIMQRAIVVLLVSIHLCSHYYYLAIIMVSFSSINHGTMLHISLLSRRSIAAASSSSIAYDEGSASMASRRPFCNNNMESLGCQYGLPRLWGHPYLLSHKTFGWERTNGSIPTYIRGILTSILRYFSGQTDKTEMKYGMYCCVYSCVYSLETMHYGLETMHNSMCSRRNTHGWIDLVEGNPTRYCTFYCMERM